MRRTERPGRVLRGGRDGKKMINEFRYTMERKNNYSTVR